jgi:hypothetical protein
MRFKTRKEAERFQTDTPHKASRGEYLESPKVPIFREVAEDWFRSKSNRRPSHVCDLRTGLDQHIFPIFGKERLDRVTVSAVEKLRDDLRDRKYQHRTIKRILRIIGAVFRLAIKRGQCSKNPVDSVERAAQAARELKAEDTAVGFSTDTRSVSGNWVFFPRPSARCRSMSSPEPKRPSNSGTRSWPPSEVTREPWKVTLNEPLNES